jgi:hypothetical protein
MDGNRLCKMCDMDALRAVEDAINRFTAWEMPWRFDEVVQSELDPEAKRCFVAISNEARAAEHWKSGDLQQCAENAVERLLRKYPTLGRRAALAVVNAAAYSWR